MGNLGSHKQRRVAAQGTYFSDAKNLSKIPTGSPHMGAPNRGGVS